MRSSRRGKYHIFAALMILIALMAGAIGAAPALAKTEPEAVNHNPNLVVTVVCNDETGEYDVTFYSFSWNPGHDNGVNEQVRLDEAVNGDDYSEIHTDAYLYGNGFEFFFKKSYPGHMERLDARVVTEVPWGPNQDIFEAGQAVEVLDVHLGPPCSKAPEPTGGITVKKFDDTNKTGEIDDGDDTVAGVVVKLYDGPTVQETPLMTATTDISGIAVFTNLPFGVYTVCEELPTGTENITPLCETVSVTEKIAGVEVKFLNREVPTAENPVDQPQQDRNIFLPSLRAAATRIFIFPNQHAVQRAA